MGGGIYLSFESASVSSFSSSSLWPDPSELDSSELDSSESDSSESKTTPAFDRSLANPLSLSSLCHCLLLCLSCRYWHARKGIDLLVFLRRSSFLWGDCSSCICWPSCTCCLSFCKGRCNVVPTSSTSPTAWDLGLNIWISYLCFSSLCGRLWLASAGSGFSSSYCLQSQLVFPLWILFLLVTLLLTHLFGMLFPCPKTVTKLNLEAALYISCSSSSESLCLAIASLDMFCTILCHALLSTTWWPSCCLQLFLCGW